MLALFLFFLLLRTCLSTPLVPRSQGISVSPVSPQTAPKSIIPGFNNSTAVVLLVALVSLALAVPMFVYIWLRRRRLLRGGARARMVVERKMSMASMASDSPLNAPQRRSTDSNVASERKAAGAISKEKGTEPEPVQLEADDPEAEPKTPRGPVRTETTSSTGTGMTLIAQPVQISVKPIRAVEIMVVKPAKSAKAALFRVSASWEKLKG